MSFFANRKRWLWVPRLTTLAGALWMGVALAEPPSRELPAGVPVVPVDDEDRQTTADELSEYMLQLERHLDWMHRRAEVRKDSDTLAAVEAIQKKLAVAKDHHRTLCRLCAERLHNTPMAKACCQKIDAVMHEVIDDHLALMRRLRARRPGPHRISR